MSTRDEHFEIARRCEAAAADNTVSHPEWAVVMMFYAALHYVEAYWCVMYAVLGTNQHYEKHRDRGEQIAIHLNPIYRDYRALERRAHDARYKGRTFSEAEVRGLWSNELKRIRSHIQQALRPPDQGGQVVT